MVGCLLLACCIALIVLCRIDSCLCCFKGGLCIGLFGGFVLWFAWFVDGLFVFASFGLLGFVWFDLMLGCGVVTWFWLLGVLGLCWFCFAGLARLWVRWGS